jgi:hypothetical protein
MSAKKLIDYLREQDPEGVIPESISISHFTKKRIDEIVTMVREIKQKSKEDIMTKINKHFQIVDKPTYKQWLVLIKQTLQALDYLEQKRNDGENLRMVIHADATISFRPEIPIPNIEPEIKKEPEPPVPVIKPEPKPEPELPRLPVEPEPAIEPRNFDREVRNLMHPTMIMVMDNPDVHDKLPETIEAINKIHEANNLIEIQGLKFIKEFPIRNLGDFNRFHTNVLQIAALIDGSLLQLIADAEQSTIKRIVRLHIYQSLEKSELSAFKVNSEIPKNPIPIPIPIPNIEPIPFDIPIKIPDPIEIPIPPNHIINPFLGLKRKQVRMLKYAHPKIIEIYKNPNLPRLEIKRAEVADDGTVNGIALHDLSETNMLVVALDSI